MIRNAKNDFILFLIVSRIKTALHTLLYGRLSYFRTYLVHSPVQLLIRKGPVLMELQPSPDARYHAHTPRLFCQM